MLSQEELSSRLDSHPFHKQQIIRCTIDAMHRIIPSEYIVFCAYDGSNVLIGAMPVVNLQSVYDQHIENTGIKEMFLLCAGGASATISIINMQGWNCSVEGLENHRDGFIAGTHGVIITNDELKNQSPKIAIRKVNFNFERPPGGKIF
jgi:hypothetical protein